MNMIQKTIYSLSVILLIIQYCAQSNLTDTNTTYDEEEYILLNETSSVENLTDLTTLLFTSTSYTTDSLLSTTTSFMTETTTSFMTDTDETSSKQLNVTSNQSQSTTPVPDATVTTTSTPPLKEETKQNECACDLLKKECDINCCCDEDCSDADKSVFDSCYTDTDQQSNGLCYSPIFLYKNNTAYKVLREEKGLFCIAQDNLPERLHYTNQKIVSSFSTFNKIWNRKKQFNWNPIVSTEIYKFSNNSYYKYGAPIWKYNYSTLSLSNIRIPISIYSGECESFRAIKYLENFESFCLYYLSSSQESCGINNALSAASFTNITLIANPININTSNLENIHEEYLVPVQTVLCEENDACIETQLLPIPTRDNSSLICQNVVKSLNIIIKHNGSVGIIDAQFVIKLANVSFNDWIMQEYKVTFEWSKNESITFKRSGTPGYIYGKPLISGYLVTRKIGEKSVQTVDISNEGKQWLTIPKAVKQGFCGERMNVIFNDNILSQCTILLDLEDTCEKLHKKVWDTLFNGYKINSSNPHQLDVLISSHGNPKTEYLKDWVPIFLEDTSDYDIKRPICPSLISGVRYHILYSYYGPISNPQAKIIGILAKIQTSNILCANRNKCLFQLFTSVTYTDVSQKAESKFAKPPIIRIRLPSDFFYPFTSIASNSNIDFIITVIYIFLLLERV